MKLKNSRSQFAIMDNTASYLATHSFSHILGSFEGMRHSRDKCLGVQIDEKLEDRYIDMISCKTASAGIGAMIRIRPFAPSNSLEKVCKSLVQPYLDYRSPLWDYWRNLPKDKIPRFQSRAPYS